MTSHRNRRVEEVIKDALREIIHEDLKDPRIPMLFSITGVRVTPDLQLARVNFSQLPDEDAAVDETLEALDSAKGYLRRQLAGRVQLRYMPALEFHYDPGMRDAARIDELLASTPRYVPQEGEDAEDEAPEGDEPSAKP